MANEPKAKRDRLAIVLLIVFAVALVMGPGPGIYLVNPDPSEPSTNRFVLGMPVVYAWAISWFFVQLAVVFVAYFTLWSRSARDAPDPPPGDVRPGPTSRD